MQKPLIRILYGMMSAALFVLAPLSTLADGVSTESTVAHPVLITEFQTGSNTSGKDEFIELYNASAAPVDIAGWQVRYVSASSVSANLSTPTQTITISAPTAGGALLLPADTYFVLHTASIALPAGVMGQTYAYTLPASGGSIVLLAPNSTMCQFEVDDAVAWGGGAFGEGQAIVAIAKDSDYQRLVAADDSYVQTYSNVSDFTVAAASPALASTATIAAGGLGNGTGGNAAPPTTSIPNPACTPSQQAGGTSSGSGSTVSNGQQDPNAGGDASQTPRSDDGPPADSLGAEDPGSADDSSAQQDMPPINAGLSEPQLTELLPNPAPPQTDASDEFVELYNPNSVPFDLSGFSLAAGLTAQHTFTFPSGTTIAPGGFAAFFSADTGLSLSNDGGAVVLEDASDNVVSKSNDYGAAKDGEAWALDQGEWMWTTTPTPNAPNIITLASAVAKQTPVSSSNKKTVAASSKATAKATKTTMVKTTAKPKPMSATASATPSAALAADAAQTPVHASVLAFAALFALLYGAYEYRRDVANRFHQLRSYRSARRQARASAAGRRSG